MDVWNDKMVQYLSSNALSTIKDFQMTTLNFKTDDSALRLAGPNGNETNGHHPSPAKVSNANALNDHEDSSMDQVMHPDEKVSEKRVEPLEEFTNRELMYQFLKNIGEDPEREGLIRTPYRIEKAWDDLTSGYRQSVEDFLNKAVFTSDADEMVVVKDIRFYGMCEHHLLPFYGTAHVAYIPSGKVVGLSKIPRIVDMYSRRLQVQESLTSQIANCINEVLKPKGVAVVMQGLHFCMMMRGVQKADAQTTTSAMLGDFRQNPQTRMEFMHHIGAPRF
jgi:GTP cyclohydrolase I